jgi:hypothetical protein
VGTALGDGSEQEFGAKPPTSEVSRNRGSRFLGGGAGVEENDDRWAGAAKSCAENTLFSGQFL